MAQEAVNPQKSIRSVRALSMVNVGIWAISMIALIFVMRHSPAAKGLFPILAGGSTVGIILYSASAKIR